MIKLKKYDNNFFRWEIDIEYSGEEDNLGLQVKEKIFKVFFNKTK